MKVDVRRVAIVYVDDKNQIIRNTDDSKIRTLILLSCLTPGYKQAARAHGCQNCDRILSAV
jgi:hypothetical protein